MWLYHHGMSQPESSNCKAAELEVGEVPAVTDCVTIHGVVTELSPAKNNSKVICSVLNRQAE